MKTMSFQLSGAQLGITVTSLIVGFLVEPVVAPVLRSGLETVGLSTNSSLGIAIAAAVVLVTTLQMVMGELIPKNLAIARPMRVAFAVSTPLRASNYLFRPFIIFLNAAANAAVRLLGIEPQEELMGVPSLEEIQVLIRSSREGGALEEESFALLARSITFGEKGAADALRPRVDVVALQQDETIERLRQVAQETGHSRFPVYGKDLDDVVGVAIVWDSYPIPPQARASTPISQIMQPALFVPESRSLSSLLADMRRERKQLVIVIDEYGGTAGIITVEDLLEEIVGDIEDEYDLSRAETTISPEGVHVVSAMLHPDEVQMQSSFEMPEGDYDTLAGFLLSLFDRIPEVGDHISHEGWEFKVVEMDRKRIAKVLMVAPVPAAAEPEDGS